ncbi:hypothetical protein BC829DRAFT_397742 [Chytridium lagenaria]|nr:hypothetical protein BC829DRAFT_397742 [Chytridium lagenaria]
MFKRSSIYYVGSASIEEMRIFLNVKEKKRQNCLYFQMLIPLALLGSLVASTYAVSWKAETELKFPNLSLLSAGIDFPGNDSASGPVRFEGEQIWRINLPTDKSVESIMLLRDVVPTIDFWSEPRLGRTVDIRIVSPDAGQALTDYLTFFNLSHTIMIPDLQAAIDKQNHLEVDMDAPEQFVLDVGMKGTKEYFSKYRKLEEIHGFMEMLNETYPDMVEFMSVGETYEGRTQTGIHIRAPGSKGKGLKKKEFVFHGGQHAREWIGPAVVQWIASELLSGYGKDKSTTKILDNFDFTIIPVLNVDGYTYTHTTNRMWRKNRQPNKGTTCVGIDPNRNWDYKWGGGGASGNPCGDTYYGDKPFAAAETKNIADYLLSRAPNVISYIDFHAYSQLWMFPYSYDCDLYADKIVEDAGKEAAKALKAVHGKSFAVGSVCNIIYPASGSSVDWAYVIGNVSFPYGLELRDTGFYGFMLPAKQIIPSGEEMFAAIQALALFILKKAM